MENTENKFKYNGAWYIAVEQDGCRNCDLSSATGLCTIGNDYRNVPPCGRHERKDNRNVIFVRSDVDNLGDEEMKYEAVFGNKDLFDGAGTFTGLDVVVHSIASGIKSYARSSDLTPESLRNHPVCAMLRIIQEPKRWTIEDWKDGRSPDVGCMVMVTSVDECASVAAINNDAVCVVFHDGEFTTLHKSGISPIEKPEEKAERLRSEWINDAINAVQKTDNTGGYEAIYDALLSGELPVPAKGGE